MCLYVLPRSFFAFLFLCLFACLFSKKREKEGLKWIEEGEDLGGDGGRENYYQNILFKNVFSIKRVIR